MMDELERAKAVNAGIKRAFLDRGGSLEQWERVRNDPRKFYRAWRRVLALPDDIKPPPAEYQDIDPSTGKRVE